MTQCSYFLRHLQNSKDVKVPLYSFKPEVPIAASLTLGLLKIILILTSLPDREAIFITGILNMHLVSLKVSLKVDRNTLFHLENNIPLLHTDAPIHDPNANKQVFE